MPSAMVISVRPNRAVLSGAGGNEALGLVPVVTLIIRLAGLLKLLNHGKTGISNVNVSLILL